MRYVLIDCEVHRDELKLFGVVTPRRELVVRQFWSQNQLCRALTKIEPRRLVVKMVYMDVKSRKSRREIRKLPLNYHRFILHRILSILKWIPDLLIHIDDQIGFSNIVFSRL